MRFICQVCGYIYDDAKENVPFASLPEDWKCPLCGAMKSDLKPEEVSQPKAIKKQTPVEADADLTTILTTASSYGKVTRSPSEGTTQL